MKRCMMIKVSRFWLHLKPIYERSDISKLEHKHFQNGVVKIVEQAVRETFEGKTDESSESQLKPQIFIHQLHKHRNNFTFEELIHDVIDVLAGVSDNDR